MDNCLFCEICEGNKPGIILYEDEEILAFRDIAPQAPLHFLLVTKKHIKSAQALTQQEGAVLAKIFMVAAQICAQEGITEGYRVVTNVGKDGGQSVGHLHFHVLAGRPLAWPPG